MALIKSSELKNRRADIRLTLDEELEVDFYEDELFCGCINYENHSVHYVNDAVENWLNCILTLEVVKHYAKSKN